jgi:ArsR family transcriptional regulator
MLRKEEMTAGDIAAQFDITKPTISHHFAVLKVASLISSRRDGQTIWYALSFLLLLAIPLGYSLLYYKRLERGGQLEA